MSTVKIKIGCIADDFTGGSDAASFLSLGGLKTILLNGIPAESFSVSASCEAVVIALKSRTQETGEAVKESLDAIRWLKERGAEKFYFKYCSTFDSTDDGNIGPVTDAIMDYLDVESTILCPALPDNGRCVKEGVLYVNGVKLEDSSMRHHPLTPMTKSRISDLMEHQGKYPCVEVHKEMLHHSEVEIQAKINEEIWYENKTLHKNGTTDREPEGSSLSKKSCRENIKYYIVPDYEDEGDAERIVELFSGMKLLTGGSGILRALGEKLKESADNADAGFEGVEGRALIVGGSCSVATGKQEKWYEAHGGISFRLSDEGIISGDENSGTIWNWVKDCGGDAPLVYSYDTPEGLSRKRNAEGKKLAAKVEELLSDVAKIARDKGFKRFIAAGGETSGAVTRALGYDSFWIGKSIAPGVPVLIPVEDTDIRLVLKSGNFGQEDFFGKALDITGECTVESESWDKGDNQL